jgi:hypothetical protein
MRKPPAKPGQEIFKGIPSMRQFFAAAGLMFATSAFAATAAPAVATPDQIVTRHIGQFLAHDWNGVMRDVAPNAIFILDQNTILQGKPAIRAFFLKLDTQKPVATFEAKLVPAIGDIGQEDWVMNPGQPGSMKGRDLFIIRGGKIVFQTTTNVRPANQP